MELIRTRPPELAVHPAVEAAAAALAEVSHHDRPAIGTALRALDVAAHEAARDASGNAPSDPEGANGRAGDVGQGARAEAALGSAVEAAEDAGDEAALGPTELVVLAAPDTDEVATAMGASGFEARRDLVQLRRPLPLEAELVDGSRRLPLRPFEPGADDAAWIRVNNRAFDWHPEQGGWSSHQLAERMAEPWFDPSGFLVLDGPEGSIYGFCWTKVHPPTEVDPELGEIFVIGVDPSAHGMGFGRSLVVAGLEHLTSRGITTAMLYTEADNDAAMALYRSLGFEEHEHTRWYHRTITPNL